MARQPAAQPVPRVSRSSRDDRYQAGHPTPGKRASAGAVASVQTDTVTVLMAEEEVTGVIPLQAIPPVGAVVEVEARGDLLVIPTWFEGPPLVGGVLDIPATLVELFASTYGTVVGGATSISVNNGDTAYVRIQKPAGGTLGYNMDVNFPATVIPGTVTAVSLVTVTKGTDSRIDTDYPFGARLLLTTTEPDYISEVWTDIAALPAVDWTELETPLTLGGEGQVTQERIESGQIEYNPGWALINDTSAGLAWDTWFTYIALRVTYEAP